MFTQEIEETIKDWIFTAFTDNADNIDQGSLAAAIASITPSNSELRRQFLKALGHYQRHTSGPSLNTKVAEEVFDKHLNQQQAIKHFDKLTFNEYLALFLHKDRWDLYRPYFSLDPDDIYRLLDGVRKIRNHIAHYQGELSSLQQEEVSFCRNWLLNHSLPKSLRATISNATKTANQDTAQATNSHILEQNSTTIEQAIPSISEDVQTETLPVTARVISRRRTVNRYAQFARHLRQQPPTVEELHLTFAEIERIIDGTLPPYARTSRTFWANDSVSHIQSQQWLQAGWRVARVNMPSEQVTFARLPREIIENATHLTNNK